MSRRERMEARLERRQDWAEGRRSKADQLRKVDEHLRHDWAFITQPGKIKARDRMNKRDERAYEHGKMATHHDQKAAGIAHALNTSIFSDDDDATEQLEAKVAKLEARRTAIKATNKIVRRKPKNEITDAKVAELVAMGYTDANAHALFEPDFCGRIGHPSYVLQNLGGNIKRCRDRIVTIKRQQDRTAEAEEAGGVRVAIVGDYARVTFAEKPERDVINALKAAGFRWGDGSWSGTAANLPDGIADA